MNEKEKEIVTPELCERNDTYNLCPGGHGGWGYINKKKSKEERSRLGKLMLESLNSRPSFKEMMKEKSSDEEEEDEDVVSLA